jgi:hypothetical protein
VLPLDVYLENENELVQAVTTGEVVDSLEQTVGAKLLRRDAESKVVVNFHGVSSPCFPLEICFLSCTHFLRGSSCPSPWVVITYLRFSVSLYRSPVTTFQMDVS